MSILETILKAQSGGLVKQVAGSLNLPEGQAGAAIAQLLPALTQGLKQNVQKPSGLESLLGALQGGNHERYVEQPERLASQETISDGNSILGHLLGSKEKSRQVAAQAAEKTGIDTGVLKKMLPMVAAMAMGSLSKESKGGALSQLLSSGSQQASSLGANVLAGFLDKDNDSSAVDNLLGMAKKLF
ncbi:MAG: DUF937 domain-containing protein [Pseudomonadota bacterium]